MSAPTDETLLDLARRLAEGLRAAGGSVTTAESCTGGWIAKVLTDIPGSSDWFAQGHVTYSNGAKSRLLGVGAGLIVREGAVSEAVVRAMAAGALAASGAGLAVAVSGIAGPGGGSTEKPVGTVWFAWAGRDGTSRVECRRFTGDRESVRRAAVARALEGLLEHVSSGLPS
jgi:nicotinamide-nucleotide amidase